MTEVPLVAMVPEWEEDKYITVVIGIVALAGSLFLGIVGNTLALKFFWKSIRNSVFSQIFCAVTLTDLLTSVLALFVGICYVQGRSPGPFSDVIFRETWGSLWNFSSRYSVYLVAVLSITRTVRILLPFTAIKMRVVQVSLIVYAAWLFCTTPAFYGISHYYKAEWCALGLNKSQFVGIGSRDATYYMIVMSIPTMLLIPVPLTFISALASLYKIIWQSRQYKKKVIAHRNFARITVTRNTTAGVTKGMKESVRRGKGNGPSKDSSFQSGITIVLITGTYLVLNIPYSVIYLYVQTRSSQLSVPPYAVVTNDYVKSYLVGVTHVLSIALNAALNPLLFYLRMKDFREHVNSLIPRRGQEIENRGTSRDEYTTPSGSGGQAVHPHFTIFNKSSPYGDLTPNTERKSLNNSPGKLYPLLTKEDNRDNKSGDPEKDDKELTDDKKPQEIVVKVDVRNNPNTEY